jgi:hypothetical protein
VVVRPVGSRLVGHPRFVVCRRFVIESALAEANSFLPGCQPFCNIRSGEICGARRCVTAVTFVKHSRGPERGLTQRNLVSTLEQSPERGDTAATQEFLETAPVSKRDGRAYQRQPRPHRHEDSSAWVCGCHTQRGVISRGQGQADLPAQQPPSRAGAWVPAADAHPRRPGDRVKPPRQGSPQAHCVIRRGN